MLKRIVELFSKTKIYPTSDIKTTPMLGRWCILNREYNNRKIDMANIDHCGTCKYHYSSVPNLTTPAESEVGMNSDSRVTQSKLSR